MRRNGTTIARPVALPLESVFDYWAPVYDRDPNPLLALEERYLAPLLPPLAGKTVLDAGCGTGRWLQACSAHKPASLIGVDISAAMLAQAHTKVDDAVLYQTTCDAMPVRSSFVDVVIGSFMLSYVKDLGAFAAECARVTRSHGHVLLTDMHPATEAAHGWTRSFRRENERVEIAAQQWSLSSILDAFKKHDFETSEILQPCFGGPEREIFEAAGRSADFGTFAASPAIYILKLQKKVRKLASTRTADTSSLQITGAACALGPATAIPSSLTVQHGRITRIGSDDTTIFRTLDLSGYLLLPGLINAHDHLEFALFPNLGRGDEALRYCNAREWAEEIHCVHAAVIAKQREIPRETQLWWGAIRNLLCGATTVCHHNAMHPLMEDSRFPVRVLSRFGWAHSLALEPALVERYTATGSTLPFILHAAEGIDNTSAEEIFELERQGILDDRTVIVHGLALNREGVALVNRRMASVVTCPTSNRFLFHKLPARLLLGSIHRIALGSDSPLTAAGDLLDEIRCAQNDIGLDSHTVYGMATTQPATMLRLRHGEGRIRRSAVADLIAVRSIQKTPANTLVQLTFDQVEMVLVGGEVQLASAEIYARLPETIREGMQPLDVNGHIRWLRAPVVDLIASAEQTLGLNGILLGGKVVRRAHGL